MGATGAVLGRVNDDGVWRTTRVAMLAAALIVLATIALGFLNILTTDELSRWQLLVHLHSGTMGWLMLGAIGAAIWRFTGQRDVDPTYATRARLIVWAAIVTFLMLIVSFAFAYSTGGQARYLLAIAAPLAALVVWAAAAFVLLGFAALRVPTATHWQLAGGLLVAGIATTLGTLMAWRQADLLAFPFEAGLLAHVFAIEGFLFLTGGGLIEWAVAETDTARGTLGIVQTLVGVFIGLLGPILFVVSLAGMNAGPLNLVLVIAILGFGALFLVRVGIRALQLNPLSNGIHAWTWFAAGWLIVAALLWPVRIGMGDPSWWIPVYAHVTFLGVLSNALLGVISARAGGLPAAYEIVEPVAMWLLNLGMVLFFATLVAMGTTHGAWVMGAGALLAVLALGVALYQAPQRGASRGTAI